MTAGVGFRLRTLVRRIEEWEDFDEPSHDASEELILDIKQCLESVLETFPEWQVNADGVMEPVQ